MGGERIKYAVSNRVAYLTLSRPEKRNALDDVAVRELSECVNTAGHEKNVRVIVFRSEGSTFSAGADLDYLLKVSKNDEAANRQDSASFADLLMEVYESRKLTCAVVRGPALAGASGLVLACDIVFASEKAVFGFPEVKIGFVPAIVLNFARRKVRESDVRRLVLTGGTLGAEEAVRIGIAPEVIPDADIERRVDEFLARFCRETSPRAVELTKQILRETGDMSLREALRYSVSKNAEARSTDDFRKGLSSFLKKEKPEWE